MTSGASRPQNPTQCHVVPPMAPALAEPIYGGSRNLEIFDFPNLNAVLAGATPMRLCGPNRLETTPLQSDASQRKKGPQQSTKKLSMAPHKAS